MRHGSNGRNHLKLRKETGDSRNDRNHPKLRKQIGHGRNDQYHLKLRKEKKIQSLLLK